MLDRIREDASVTRRDYLRILVTISGGLLAGTAAVALGLFGRRDEATGVEVPVAREIAPGESVRFRYPSEEDPAIAIRLADGALVAYSSVCASVLHRALEPRGRRITARVTAASSIRQTDTWWPVRRLGAPVDSSTGRTGSTP
jgi:hypothetical protein